MAKPAKAAKAASRKAKAGTAGAEAEFALLEYLDGLVDDLREHVPAALRAFETDGIHDARVSTRRLKAAVDMLEPVLSKGSRKPFTRVLQKLRRRLGPLRDLDVMLEHLAELGANPRQQPAARWLGEHLERERLACRDEAKSRPGPSSVLGKVGSWWGLREEIAEAREAVDSLLAESLHLQLDAFAEQADLIAAQQRPHRQGGPAAESEGAAPTAPVAPTVPVSQPAPAGAPAAGAADTAGAPNPHELRIAGKALRYTLEMAKEQGHDLPGGVAKAFKKMQESLGAWHDYVVLTEKAMAVSTRTMLAHHDAPTQEAVLELARVTMQRAAKELQKFAGLWTSRGQDLAATIRSAFPLTPSLQEARKATGAATGAAAAAKETGAESAGATADGAGASATTAATAAGSTGSKTGPGPTGSAPSAAPAAPAPGEPSAA